MWFHYTAKQINHEIKKSSEYCHVVDWTQKVVCDPNDISDWYHTFWELYKHRTHLFIALCKVRYNANSFDNWLVKVIRSKIHEDGFNVWNKWGMFLLCMHHPELWQISYHIDKNLWDKLEYVITEEQATIPFDGHTSDDVLERLLNI